MDKKMYKYIGILVGLIVLLIAFFWFTNNVLKGGKKYDYNDVEELLASAARKYAENNPNVLPDVNNTSVTISSSTLVGGGYVDELSSYVNKDVICTGEVEIYLTDEEHYNYVPMLDCGNAYSAIRLADKVIADNEFGVVYGSGLYQRVNGEFVTREDELTNGGSDSFEYVFRGDEVNNFVKIDDNYWRIVSISEYNDMLLIFTSYTQKPSVWDDRYNDDVNKNQGINDYEKNGIKSRALTSVEDFYDGTAKLFNKEKYSEKTRYLTSPMDLCVGKRSENDSDMSGAMECNTILQDQYAGLLPAYYYMSASLDENCNSITSKNCGNYNYLSQFNDYWWLLTADSETTNQAYAVNKNHVENSLCSYKANIRPIILLGSRAVYNGGSGTESDPYTVKFYE